MGKGSRPPHPHNGVAVAAYDDIDPATCPANRWSRSNPRWVSAIILLAPQVLICHRPSRCLYVRGEGDTWAGAAGNRHILGGQPEDSYLLAAQLFDYPGLDLAGQGRGRVRHHVSPKDRKVGAVDELGQDCLPLIELVVSQRHGVVPQLVVEVEVGLAGEQVEIEGALEDVAGVQQQQIAAGARISSIAVFRLATPPSSLSPVLTGSMWGVVVCVEYPERVTLVVRAVAGRCGVDDQQRRQSNAEKVLVILYG